MERLPEIIIPERTTVGGPDGEKNLISVEGEFIPPKVLEFVDKYPPVTSPRQREIIQQIIEGNTLDKQIALNLGLAKNTVRNHIQRMRLNLEKRGHDLSGPNPRTRK